MLATIVGYYGPPLFGLLGAALLVHGSATGVLWVFLVLLGGLLLLVRNLFGALVVVATGALFYLTVTYGSVQAQLLVACSWVWLLLLSGVVYGLRALPAPERTTRSCAGTPSSRGSSGRRSASSSRSAHSGTAAPGCRASPGPEPS